jgi:hypothetical protein
MSPCYCSAGWRRYVEDYPGLTGSQLIKGGARPNNRQGAAVIIDSFSRKKRKESKAQVVVVRFVDEK